ncbi:cysteine hydrolase family protein [Cytobacillus purgationiresistens]|uniref:Nicotinamidase-related amidase n=1 Tax=Cytobacillus purgationiresistens TaxID=863449 RepID=A0ABU0AC91_9BACI|nr:isochorismatase family cysteine hydrolase [Cytobacillus purgationiresistens]MDQ0268417.1 nicotinamidase-related amidase [Cytobacillus purgationiresistens]
MKKALINIDYTNDFVTGALPCGQPAIEIENEINRITKQFIDEGEYTVFAIDLHHEDDPYHPETPLYPPHNIEGTEGRNLYGKLDALYDKNQSSDHVVWMDKTRYSAFAGTDLEMKLRERNITEVHLVGVCTDICVLHTAVDAYNKGFKIIIYENATASFNQIGHEWALQHFKSSMNAVVK